MRGWHKGLRESQVMYVEEAEVEEGLQILNLFSWLQFARRDDTSF